MDCFFKAVHFFSGRRQESRIVSDFLCVFINEFCEIHSRFHPSIREYRRIFYNPRESIIPLKISELG